MAGEFTHCFYKPGARIMQDVAVQLSDGSWIGGYSRETPEQLQARTGAVLTEWAVAEVEMEKGRRAHYCTGVTEINEDKWHEMFEILPPEQLNFDAGLRTFHISERLCGDLVQWFVGYQGRWFTLNESTTVTREALLAMVQAFIATQADAESAPPEELEAASAMLGNLENGNLQCGCEPDNCSHHYIG